MSYAWYELSKVPETSVMLLLYYSFVIGMVILKIGIFTVYDNIYYINHHVKGNNFPLHLILQ